jgi:hypothetical protein
MLLEFLQAALKKINELKATIADFDAGELSLQTSINLMDRVDTFVARWQIQQLMHGQSTGKGTPYANAAYNGLENEKGKDKGKGKKGKEKGKGKEGGKYFDPKGGKGGGGPPDGGGAGGAAPYGGGQGYNKGGGQGGGYQAGGGKAPGKGKGGGGYQGGQQRPWNHPNYQNTGKPQNWQNSWKTSTQSYATDWSQKRCGLCRRTNHNTEECFLNKKGAGENWSTGANWQQDQSWYQQQQQGPPQQMAPWAPQSWQSAPAQWIAPPQQYPAQGQFYQNTGQMPQAQYQAPYPSPPPSGCNGSQQLLSIKDGTSGSSRHWPSTS